MTQNEFNQVFEAYRMYVFYFCNKSVNHVQDAEDITVSVFLSLWEHLDSVPVNSAKAYLIVSANRKCIDFLRRQKRNRGQAILFYNMGELEESFLPFPYEIEIDADVVGFIYALINSLTPQQKKTILLKYKDGKEVKDIAKLLGLSPQTISNTITDGLIRLRHLVKTKMGQ